MQHWLPRRSAWLFSAAAAASLIAGALPGALHAQGPTIALVVGVKGDPFYAYLFWGAEYWLLRSQSGDPSYVQAFARVLENA